MTFSRRNHRGIFRTLSVRKPVISVNRKCTNLPVAHVEVKVIERQRAGVGVTVIEHQRSGRRLKCYREAF